jgi:hypothetical protein
MRKKELINILCIPKHDLLRKARGSSVGREAAKHQTPIDARPRRRRWLWWRRLWIWPATHFILLYRKYGHFLSEDELMIDALMILFER